ncbi:MAG: restriction endonuclease subunit S [Cyanobacteria bacterium SBC]|nr:restriction endonuclease subunit S [Cyanobacteria bacterium SBC]
MKDVVYFQEGPGLRNWQYGKTGIPFLNIRTIQESGRIDKSLCQFVKESEFRDRYEHFLLEAGDYVVSSSGTLGKLAEVHEEDLPIMLNTSVIRFRSLDVSKLDRVFLKWFIKSPLYIRQIQQVSTGTAIKNYGPSHLKKMIIPLPPIEEQKRIAEILDKADAVRRKRQEAIRLTEELLRSTFLEMFGDLFLFRNKNLPNPKKFKLCKLGEEITLQRGFDINKKQCQEGRYPVISSGGISVYHSEFKAHGPGVLLGRKGSVGKIHYIESDYWPHDTTLWVREFNNNNPLFVYFFFKNFPISDFEASTANPTLNRNRLHPLSVLWPDRELQLQFAMKAKKIFKTQNVLTSHLQESENLFNSLLQRAFRGEL